MCGKAVSMVATAGGHKRLVEFGVMTRVVAELAADPANAAAGGQEGRRSGRAGRTVHDHLTTTTP
uniref:Uncharacterized protein n=1 Tax=Oryza barthii TaxID=65489 RepID=A0A0D3HU02_9ORYZ